MSAPEPKDLRALGDRLDAVQRQRTARDNPAPPNAMGIAFRFTTELVSALVVGGGLGWGIDWAFDRWSPIHTRPFGLIVMFVIGAAAGILNVIRAAKDINAEIAASRDEQGE